MKISDFGENHFFPTTTKLKQLTIWFMKVSLLSMIIVLTSLQLIIAAPARSQAFDKTKISIISNNISLKQVIGEIEKQTSFRFAYVDMDIAKFRNLSLSYRNILLSEFLENMLQQTDLEYSVKNNTIILLKREKEKNWRLAPEEKIISGTVLDEKGNPLKGASVTVKGDENNGTLTDENGKFNLNVKSDLATIIVSFIGYNPQEIKVGTVSNFTINLKPNNTSLNDVVVTAFGVANSKRSQVNTISSVSAAQITHAGADNIGTALIGKIPGADLVNTSGGPMAGTRINIRGINSLDVNTRPLIVVNGIPIFDNDDSYSARGFGGNLKGSGINDINPDDIETVTVLKGANAAALYGSQAINGAILIQTKTGRVQKGFGVELNSNYTYNQNYFFPEFQQQYGAGVSADIFDRYLYNVQTPGDSMPFYSPNISTINFGPKFNNQNVRWWDGSVQTWKGQPNNYRDLFQDGHSLNNTIAFSGATDKSSFRLSATNYDYKGFLPNQKESRNSVLLNVRQKISDAITAEFYANYIDNYRQNPPERIDRANFSMMNNDITSIIQSNAINNLSYYLTDSAFKYVNGTNLSNNIILPLIWDQKMNQYQDHRTTFLGTATVTIKLPWHLSLRLRGGTDRLADLLELKRPFTAYAAPTNLSANQGGYNKTITNNYKNHGDVLLSYNNEINKNFSLSAFVGYSMDDEYDEANSISSANGLMYNNIYTTANYKAILITLPGATTTTTRPGYNASASQGGDRLNAIFGSATLSYKKWLYLNVTDRNDWSSFLPAQSNQYNYPSFGAGFIFSDLWKMPAAVTYGKLKVSYGVTGVPGTRYFSNANYSQGAVYNTAILSSFSNTVPPANLVAEKNHAFEIGLEGGLWDNRLKFDITYYNNSSNNMINSVAIAASTGATNMNINAGSLQNSGVELQLTGDVIRTKNILWQMTLNGTQIKRKVLSLPAGLTKRVLANNFTTQEVAIAGQAPYDFYMTPLMTNTDGSIQVNASGIPVFSTTPVKAGNPLPKMYGGFINNFTYKNFNLNVLLQYRFGGQVVSYDNEFWTATGLSKNSLFGRDAANGGLPYYVKGGVNIAGTAPAGYVQYNDGIIFNGEYANGQPNTSIVRASTYYQNRYYNFGTTDAVFNNDYIKLGEISLTYAFPESMIKKLRLQGLSLSLIARNIGFLYKTVPNESPDATMGTDNGYTGMMYSAYPPTRDFGASFKVRF